MENKEIFQTSTDYNLFNNDDDVPLVCYTPTIFSEDIQQDQNQSCYNISSTSSCSSSEISNNIDRISKRERKKMLNRKAATRLRQKKKNEIKELQDSNKNLKNEIEQMECIIMKLRQQIIELEMKKDL